nr:hypothetical protein [Deltaproteobacteria bacterium]
MIARTTAAMLWLAIAACNTPKSSGNGGSSTQVITPPTTTSDGAPMTDSPPTNDDSYPLLDSAKQAVPGALGIEEVELGAAGLKGYWIGLSSGPPDRGIGVVSPDGKTFFKRDDGMRRVLAITKDPMVLARASMLLLEHGGSPLASAADLPAKSQGEAKGATITAPTLTGTTLTYWSYYRKTTRPELLR